MVLDDQNWDSLIENTGNFVLHLDKEEAMFLDWITTLHSWDYDLFERLNSPEMKYFKEDLGKVVLEMGDSVELEKDIFKHIFTICPITFRFGYSEDLGLSVKR